jgi:hypothetical protein
VNELISLKEMARLAKVSPERLKNMFTLGGSFAMVPRSFSAEGSLIVYKKDFLPHLEKKLEADAKYIENAPSEWDLHFSTPVLYDLS